MMTKSEAETIARIIGTADGGCPVCVHNLVEQLNTAALGWRFIETDRCEEPTDEEMDTGDYEAPGVIVEIQPNL